MGAVSRGLPVLNNHACRSRTYLLTSEAAACCLSSYLVPSKLLTLHIDSLFSRPVILDTFLLGLLR